MMPKALVVLPHDTVLRAEGHRVRLLGILGLLGPIELGWLLPSSTPAEDRGCLGGAPLFEFHEPRLLGRTVPYLTGFSSSFRLAFKEALDAFQPTAIIADLPWTVDWMARETRIPIVYLSHGVERDFTDTTLLHLGIKLWPLTVLARAAVGAVERRSCAAATCTAAMSDFDAARYRSLYGSAASSVFGVPQPVCLAAGPDANELRRLRHQSRAQLGLAEQETVCVFHGSSHHVPNRKAIDLICERVAPAFMGSGLPLRFIIGGTGLQPFESDNVRCLGFVDRLDSFLAAADIAILPITHGAGVRMKTFDYVRASLPLVGTRKALEGVDFVDGVHAAISGDSITEFIDRLRAVAQDRPGWKSLTEQARSHVAERYDPLKVRHSFTTELEKHGVQLAPPQKNGARANAT